MTTSEYTTINARALLPAEEAAPPFLYLSAPEGDPLAAELPGVLSRCGLPPLHTEHGDTIMMMAARGRWRVEIGPGKFVTVWSPHFTPGKPDMEVATDITVTDPPQWCAEAVKQRECLLLAGPTLPFRTGDNLSVGQLIADVDGRPAVAGVMPVVSRRRVG